ncbi:hypothetical protein [Stenotrophomonas sp. PS02289]|uniref:hypothetical protein n=1 Tax=Stenotrophomonas sp. PS02289 TaxID=2991422 RepID=UPI00249CCFE1|nr:hypothetical protein [Stenotrophomonas sp. PS02289]
MPYPVALALANATTALASRATDMAVSGTCRAIDYVANVEPSHALALVGPSARALMPYAADLAATALRSMLMTVVNAESSTALTLPSAPDAYRERTQVGAYTGEDMWSPCLQFLARAALTWIALETMRSEPARPLAGDTAWPTLNQPALDALFLEGQFQGYEHGAANALVRIEHLHPHFVEGYRLGYASAQRWAGTLTRAP